MKEVNHTLDRNDITIHLEWTGGNGNRIMLVSPTKENPMSWFSYRNRLIRNNGIRPSFWILWGDAKKPITEMAEEECLTPTGKSSSLGGASRRFHRMVRAAQVVNFS